MSNEFNHDSEYDLIKDYKAKNTEDLNIQIVRISERMKSIDEKVSEIKDNYVTTVRLNALEKEVEDIKERVDQMSSKIIPVDRIARLERIVYGAVGIALIGLLTALMNLVVKSAS